MLSREDAPEQLLEQLSNYAAGPDLEGAKAPLRTFFNAVENIQPYGPEDRRGTGLPENLAGLTEPIVVDAAASRQEAERRLRNLRAVVERFDGEELAHDARPRFRSSGRGSRVRVCWRCSSRRWSSEFGPRPLRTSSRRTGWLAAWRNSSTDSKMTSRSE